MELKLSRDYVAHPLGVKERLCYEDAYHLYIEQNWCFKKITQYFNRKGSWGSRQIKQYNLKRTKEQDKLSLENYYMETIGVKNPALKPGAREKMESTMLEKYGITNIAHKEDTIEKRKATCLEKYGVDNVAKSQQIKDKTKHTNIEKFGVEWVAQNKTIRDKQKQTLLENYGVTVPLKNPEIKEKQRQTCLERYGSHNVFTLKEFQDKQKETIRKLYGVDNAFQNPQIRELYKQTMMDLYGQDNPFKLPETLEKAKHTVQEKYEVDNVSQNDDIKKLKAETTFKHYGVNTPFESDVIKLKQIQTWLDNYGVDNPLKCPEILQKVIDTKRQNGTFNTSKPVKQILELLLQKFDDVQTEYNKDERYPYRCDFYIPSLDLFIEYQGFYTHGKEPFNQNNPKHIKEWEDIRTKIHQLKQENKDKSIHETKLSTWIISDPIKRMTALVNNLNWLEFFTMEQFMEWYSILK